jgi:plastocyanin
VGITIRQQVSELNATLLGVVTDLECPRCRRVYADLRQESIHVVKRGIPAPFVAPTWGETGRRRQVLLDAQAIVLDREAHGLRTPFGAARCPHCRVGVRRGPDPTFAPFKLWLVLGVFVGLVAAVIAFAVVVNNHGGTHAQAVDAAISAAAFAFGLSLLMAVLIGILRRRVAVLAMRRPSSEAPLDAARPEQWAVIQEQAERIGVDPTALWFAGSPALEVAPGTEVTWHDQVRTHLDLYNVVAIVSPRPATPSSSVEG